MSVLQEEFAAEEVVQDAFLKAFIALGSFNKQSKFSSRLYRIVLNEAYAKLKKMKWYMVSFTENYDEEIMDEKCFIVHESR